MLDNLEMTNLKLKVREERNNIIFKSKELNKLITERDSSIEDFKSKQFMFENIVSSKNNSVIDNHNTDNLSNSNFKNQKYNLNYSLATNTINMKFNSKDRFKSFKYDDYDSNRN